MENHIELEQKYLPACGLEGAEALIAQVPRFLAEVCGCKVADLGEAEQEDVYLDTADGTLHALGGTLRVRGREGRYELTVKLPAAPDGPADSGLARHEYNCPLTEQASWRTEGAAFLRSHLGEAIPPDALEETVVILDRRRSFRVVDISGGAEEGYELSFDRVTYRSRRTGRAHAELQVELERKADGPDRGGMARLTDALSAAFPSLLPSRESKYARAVRLTIGLDHAVASQPIG